MNERPFDRLRVNGGIESLADFVQVLGGFKIVLTTLRHTDSILCQDLRNPRRWEVVEASCHREPAAGASPVSEGPRTRPGAFRLKDSRARRVAPLQAVE